MPMFRWDSSLSIGNDELDSHHKHLFDIFNTLYDGCVSVDYVNCLGSTIDELMDYTNYHFAAEEAYMEKVGYQFIENHKAEHNAFKDRILHLRQTYKSNDIALSKEVIVYLGNWLMKHVMVEDTKIGSC